jgi:hypothetical protein
VRSRPSVPPVPRGVPGRHPAAPAAGRGRRANILRNDIRRACRTGQRTVLVTAANAGLIRLFCARHVHDEVIEHSGEWTATGPVTRNGFLRAWLLEYLPLIRVVPIGAGHLAWLGPAELARVRHLAQPAQDPDDVPSAVLALLLGAFFLSGDVKPLRAVYGLSLVISLVPEISPRS